MNINADDKSKWNEHDNFGFAIKRYECCTMHDIWSVIVWKRFQRSDDRSGILTRALLFDRDRMNFYRDVVSRNYYKLRLYLIILHECNSQSWKLQKFGAQLFQREMIHAPRFRLRQFTTVTSYLSCLQRDTVIVITVNVLAHMQTKLPVSFAYYVPDGHENQKL